MLQDEIFGRPVEIVLQVDADTCKGRLHRQGPDRVKHLCTDQMRVHHGGDIKVVSCADVLTNPNASAELDRATRLMLRFIGWRKFRHVPRMCRRAGCNFAGKRAWCNYAVEMREEGVLLTGSGTTVREPRSNLCDSGQRLLVLYANVTQLAVDQDNIPPQAHFKMQRHGSFGGWSFASATVAMLIATPICPPSSTRFSRTLGVGTQSFCF